MHVKGYTRNPMGRGVRRRGGTSTGVGVRTVRLLFLQRDFIEKRLLFLQRDLIEK